MKAPNRFQTGEIQKLKKKCKQHDVAILSNSVTSTDVSLAYHVYYLWSMGYSLGTIYIHKTEFHSIKSQAISAFLAVNGYNPHFP
jgi:hypothetical protein